MLSERCSIGMTLALSFLSFSPIEKKVVELVDRKNEVYFYAPYGSQYDGAAKGTEEETSDDEKLQT